MHVMQDRMDVMAMLIRVMVEGRARPLVERCAEAIAAAVRAGV